jgi:hypothetical protein
MANSNQITNRTATAAPGFGGTVKAFRATIALVAGDLTLNAVHGALDLPAGVEVLGGAIWATDMDTNGTPLVAFHVGDAADADRYFVSSTVGQTGTVSTAMAVTGYGNVTTAKTRVNVTVSAAAATAAAGTLNVVLFGRVSDPA